jgi:flagellar basal-body rod modification protein FlgD
MSALSSAGGTQTAAQTSNQFLTMLVAQMQNQDPLNPMDNAEITTQMAQIQTVQGVQTMNTTMQGLSTQMVQMQAVQATSLIGKQVTVPGNLVTMNDGNAEGSFTLSSAATDVQLSIVSPSGQVVGTQDLHAQSAGTIPFTWPAGEYASSTGLKFQISAVNGSTPVSSTSLMQDTVESVNTTGGQLMLQLQNSGNVAYTTVQSLN